KRPLARRRFRYRTNSVEAPSSISTSSNAVGRRASQRTAPIAMLASAVSANALSVKSIMASYRRQAALELAATGCNVAQLRRTVHKHRVADAIKNLFAVFFAALFVS